MSMDKKRAEEWFGKLIREGMGMVAVLGPKGTYKYVSPSYKTILGYEADELIGINAFELMHPEDSERTFEDFLSHKTSKKEKSSPYRFRKKDGSYIWLQSFGTNLLDDPDVNGIVVNSVDATESHYYNRLDSLERKVLEMNSAGKDLESLLSVYIQGIEEIHPGMLCSIMKVEENQLFNVVSPNLPKTYVEAIEGLEIGKNRGACGTAAYLGEKVIISDAETDERTSDFLELVEKYQFKALWSCPVKDEDQKVIATIAAYYHEAGEPGGYEEKTIDRASQLLQVIFKSHRAVQALHESNMRFMYANKATEEVIYDHDMEGDEIMLSENFERIFGYTFADEEFNLEKWASYVHPDDRDEINRRLESILKDGETNKWEAEFRYARKDGTYAHVFENSFIIRDKTGKPVRMIGSVRDVTDRKNREVKQKLITEVSRAFNETEGVRKSLKKALNEFKEFGNFELAEVWLTGYEEKTIELAAALDKEVKKFYDSDDGIVTVKYGEGLPGKIWKSGKVQFWKNLDKRKSFLRRKAAVKEGLKSVYGVPIINKDEVIGVLVLGIKENVNKPDIYSSILKEIAVHVGEEIKRKELEEELSRIFSSAPDGICVAGFDGYFKKVNPAMSEMLGYTEEEFLTTPIVGFTHPEDRKKTEEVLGALKEGEEKIYFENRYITKSGEIVWLLWTTKVYHEEEIVFSVAKDITKQKELELLLDNANRLAKIGSWELDLRENDNEMYWSDMTREILEVEKGYNPTLTGGFEFYTSESKELIQHAVDKAIKKGKPFDLELLITTAKGNEKWIRCIGQSEIVDGECVRLYGSYQDIHQRKKAEVALQKAFEEKNEILESIGDAFFALDNNWTVTYWNHMAEEVLGMPREKILGENLWDLYEDAKSLDFYSQYHKAVNEQVTVHFEEFYPTLEKWFEVSAYPSSSGLSVYFKDVTERKETERQLKKLNRSLEKQAEELAASNAELEQFAFVASHDLQEPLRMITGFLDLLEKKYDPVLDEKGRKYIHFATDGAKRMREIILDLLEFSRVGRVDNEREEVDMNHLLDEVISLNKKMIIENGAKIESDDLPIITAAKSPMRQLLQNLISNALKYQPKENTPKVKVLCSEGENHWDFTIEDNGIGIHSDYSEKIFNIFQRLHGKEEYSGSGMGLAICKKIVEEHGGEIWVESEEGEGSTFHFTVAK